MAHPVNDGQCREESNPEKSNLQLQICNLFLLLNDAIGNFQNPIVAAFRERNQARRYIKDFLVVIDKLFIYEILLFINHAITIQ